MKKIRHVTRIDIYEYVQLKRVQGKTQIAIICEQVTFCVDLDNDRNIIVFCIFIFFIFISQIVYFASV